MMVRLCILALFFAVGACSATPVPIPFEDGGAFADLQFVGGPDQGSQSDGIVSMPDASMADTMSPIPCGDGGDGLCGDVGPSDAMGERLGDGGVDVMEEGGAPAEAGFDSCCAADLQQGDAPPPDLI